MKYDLTKESDRGLYIESLELSFISDLRNNGVNLSDSTISSIGQSSITIGTNINPKPNYIFDNCSTFDIHIRRNGDINLSCGTSGVFNPSKKEGDYYRLYNVGQLLNNWDEVIPLVKDYCSKMGELHNIKISQQ